MNRRIIGSPVQRHRTGGLLPIIALLVLPAWGCGTSGVAVEHRDLVSAYRSTEPRETLSAAGGDSLFAGASALERSALVAAVLARNPGVEAARQGWRAALARYPQAGALPDPELSYSLAPGSIPDDPPRFGNSVELRQRFPFPGKLGLAEAAAQAEAEAAHQDYQAVRISLASMASDLLDDYYLTARSLEINDEHIRLLDEYRSIATARYGAGTATLEEPLKAEVEATHLEHRQMQLHRSLDTVKAQLNALLHRDLGAPLPPPAPLAMPDTDAVELLDPEAEALQARPEVRKAEAEIRGSQATLDLAGKESYPDFGLMGTYNNMWAMPAHQWMVGVSVNLPLQLGKRSAAREEARARLSRALSQEASTRDAVRFEVRRAELSLEESHHIVDLFQSRLLPASHDDVEAARSGYESGRSSFLTLIEAQKNLRNVELGFEEALTDYYRARTELARATGRVPALREGDQP